MWWVALIAFASDGEARELAGAERLVGEASFETAIPILRDLLYPPRVRGLAMKRARLALAQALFFTGDHAGARTELRYVFKASPTTDIDRDRTPPQFATFFLDVKDDVVARRKTPALPLKAEPTRVVEHVIERVKYVGMPSSSPSSSESAAVSATPWFVRALPFGVGQFANHDPLGGALWLTASVVVIGANVVFSVLAANHTRDDGSYRRDATGFYVGQQVSAALAFVVPVLGVVDAFVWSDRRVRR